jgi:hypothetical protein
MCSGTESPLLALKLISRAIKEQHGLDIEIHHVFACEIEPYKQAYIERNFSPPILFRDVCELGDDQAHTAYGALVDVPGDVDILVAGTSCVDYSGLNNMKKGLNDGGESGRTFFGMLNWVEKHQPSIVILENVKSAPWADVAQAFVDIEYDVNAAACGAARWSSPLLAVRLLEHVRHEELLHPAHAPARLPHRDAQHQGRLRGQLGGADHEHGPACVFLARVVPAADGRPAYPTRAPAVRTGRGLWSFALDNRLEPLPRSPRVRTRR